MTLQIAVYGVSGKVGSALLIHLLKSELIRSGDGIVLVGRGTEESYGKLLAIQTDLADAFDNAASTMRLCMSMEELSQVDVFLMLAGATIDASTRTRQDLAQTNLGLFEDCAKTLARRSPEALTIIVSNPVELGVAVFAKHLGRARVLGMGAQQDSIRFSRAIAKRLGVGSHAVRASVLGEHGEQMIPLWSSVFLSEATHTESESLRNLREENRGWSKQEMASAALRNALPLLQAHHAKEAYELLADRPPELKPLVEPYITARLLHSTPNATANATMSLLEALVQADGRKVHGQVQLDGEFCGVSGVFGIPLTLRFTGWSVSSFDPLTKEELKDVRIASETINHFLAPLLEKHS